MSLLHLSVSIMAAPGGDTGVQPSGRPTGGGGAGAHADGAAAQEYGQRIAVLGSDLVPGMVALLGERDAP